MSKTLLVVDDALIIREMIKDAARAGGWEIVGEAADGREAVERFVELQPDAMTLDVVMPQFDGLHALRTLREFASNANVLMVSALDQKEVLREALRLGARDFIAKPFDRTRLVSALDKMHASASGAPVA